MREKSCINHDNTFRRRPPLHQQSMPLNLQGWRCWRRLRRKGFGFLCWQPRTCSLTRPAPRRDAVVSEKPDLGPKICDRQDSRGFLKSHKHDATFLQAGKFCNVTSASEGFYTTWIWAPLITEIASTATSHISAQNKLPLRDHEKTNYTTGEHKRGRMQIETIKKAKGVVVGGAAGPAAELCGEVIK